MKALYLVKHVDDFKQADLASCFEVREVDVPVPKSGEVLIKVECSPINPSNMSVLKGTYDSSTAAPLPALVGTEGSGTVVASGGGLMSWMIDGKRVGAVAKTGGMWAEYAVVPATACIPLADDVSFESGCSCFVNPLTAIAFVEIAQSRKLKAIVHTAGASALGKMLVRFARENGISVICVVRRQEQVDTLKELGAQYIVNSSNADWKATLAALCTEHNATLGFEAIAGSTTGEVLSAMPPNSELMVYGGLSEQACSAISPTELIFKGKKVSGFWLTGYLNNRGMLGAKSMLNKVGKGLNSTFKTVVGSSFALEDVVLAVGSNMSNDKVAFAPGKAPQTQASSSN